MKNIIERKLAAGVLPDRPPVKYWAGFGVGQPCDGCDEPILDTQVEYEVVFDAFPTVRLHTLCAEIWGALVAHAGRLWREARDGEVLVGFSAIVAAVEELLTRSPTLCLANLAVLEASRYPMARRGHLFSTTPESEDPLLDTVRTRLSSGTLFPVDRKSCTGWGSGKPCAVCDLPINHRDIEYEVAGGPSGSVCVHLPCYLVWRQESKALHWSEGTRHPRRTTDELLAQLRGSRDADQVLLVRVVDEAAHQPE